jgi:hypothetical protein
MSRKLMGMVGMATIVLGGLLGRAGLAQAGENATAKDGVDAKAAFARLKTLAGIWKGQVDSAQEAAKKKEHSERHPAESTVTYRLTGAGSALVETMMPGTDHEMVSVYHLDGPDLRMTHYCAIGNQPRVKLDRVHSRPDHLIFVFDGGSNFNPAKDMHIHGLEVTFHEDGRVTSAWESYAGGKTAGIHAFIMSRQGGGSHD